MSVYEGCLSYLRGGDRHYCFVKPVLKKDVLARTIWSLIKSVYTRNHTRIDFAAGCTMDNNISYCIIHGCTGRFGIDVTVHLYPSVCVLLYRQPICDCKGKNHCNVFLCAVSENPVDLAINHVLFVLFSSCDTHLP